MEVIDGDVGRLHVERALDGGSGLDRHRGDQADHARWVGQRPIGQICVTRQNNR